jgi:serine/threonine protein kinase
LLGNKKGWYVVEGAIIANRFRLDEALGQGGMGTVFRGVDLTSGTDVAVKWLKLGLIDQSPQMVERFRREGEVLRALNHPNIIHVVEAVEYNDQHYLIMEYAPGGSVRDLIAEGGPLDLARALEIAIPVADALHSAHELAVIHRDVKPPNILLAVDGSPRLTDFGLARIDYLSRVTEAGQLVGTYSYLSPEAINAEEVDVRADVWSFGVTLFEMLAGENPFQRKTPTQSLVAVVTEPVPDLAAVRPDLPPSLVSLIHGMLVKQRGERIASIQEVRAALQSLLD